MPTKNEKRKLERAVDAAVARELSYTEHLMKLLATTDSISDRLQRIREELVRIADNPEQQHDHETCSALELFNLICKVNKNMRQYEN